MNRNLSITVTFEPTMDQERFRGKHPITPDGRYFVVGGRLWRMSNPALAEEKRAELVRALGSARRDVRKFKFEPERLRQARSRVDQIKRALGERGDVWWQDGALDYNRYLVQNTPYATWFRDLRHGEARSSKTA